MGNYIQQCCDHNHDIQQKRSKKYYIMQQYYQETPFLQSHHPHYPYHLHQNIIQQGDEEEDTKFQQPFSPQFQYSRQERQKPKKYLRISHISSEKYQNQTYTLFYCRVKQSDNILQEKWLYRVNKQKINSDSDMFREFLAALKVMGSYSHLIPKIYERIQDKKYYYIATDNFSGGRLSSYFIHKLEKSKVFQPQAHIYRHIKRDLKKLQFMIACILKGLQFLHSNGLFCESLRYGENIMLDQDGYFRIGNLQGLMRDRMRDYNSKGEIFPSKYDNYWQLGLLIYEYTQDVFLTQKNDPQYIEMCQEICMTSPHTNLKWKQGTPPEIIDIVNRLLVYNIQKRKTLLIQSRLMQSPLFDNFDWDSLILKKMQSPVKGLVKKYGIKYDGKTEKSLKYRESMKRFDIESQQESQMENMQRMYQDLHKMNQKCLRQHHAP